MLAMAFIGCQEQQVAEPAPQPELVVEISELSLDYTAQEVEIAVSTNQSLEVEVAVRWILYAISEGGDSVSLLISENKESEPRSAEVVIKAGDLSHNVTIHQGVKPQTMQLTIGHKSRSLDSPAWEGVDVKGIVDWGDGTTEEYHEGISHDYASDDTHLARFTMEGATQFHIERIGDIESVILAL